MHQGQFQTLEEVVRFYDTLEGATSLDHHSEVVLQPLALTAQERADLVAFLKGVQGAPPGSEVHANPAAVQAPESAQKPTSGASQTP
jgi:cytochrome c peroxidase